MDCKWSAWGACSKPCGNGTQSRTIEIQANGGLECVEKREQECNTENCPIQCQSGCKEIRDRCICNSKDLNEWQISWVKAKKRCKTLYNGGVLASIRDQADHDAFSGKFSIFRILTVYCIMLSYLNLWHLNRALSTQ